MTMHNYNPFEAQMFIDSRTRNGEVLTDFVKYCIAHPSERFWQALLNWSKVPYLLVSKYPVYDIRGGSGYLSVEDPYNWEERNEL